MSYLVTGATGFIGRRLVEQLLGQTPGQGVRARREASLERLDDLIARWSIVAGPAAAKRVQPVLGDLRRPLLGVEQEQVAELRGKITHFFHSRRRVRPDRAGRAEHGGQRRGTTHAVELGRAGRR